MFKHFTKVPVSVHSGHSGHSDAQAWASECPDVKNYKWRLNQVWHRTPYSCTHMATVGVEGLSTVTASQVISRHFHSCLCRDVMTHCVTCHCSFLLTAASRWFGLLFLRVTDVCAWCRLACRRRHYHPGANSTGRRRVGRRIHRLALQRSTSDFSIHVDTDNNY